MIIEVEKRKKGRRPRTGDRLRVKEIYPAILGESLWAGWPGTIIRLAECNLRCSYCDTTSAYSGGRIMSGSQVCRVAQQRGLPRILVTGGEPLLQSAAIQLLAELAARGFQTMLETNGSLPLDQVPARVHLVMDLKTPGSKQAHKNNWDNLAALKPTDEIKLVLTGRKDYLWAKNAIREHDLAARFPLTLSPVHGRLDPKDLVRWMLKDKLQARLGLQIHKYIFGPAAKKV